MATRCSGDSAELATQLRVKEESLLPKVVVRGRQLELTGHSGAVEVSRSEHFRIFSTMNSRRSSDLRSRNECIQLNRSSSNLSPSLDVPIHIYLLANPDKRREIASKLSVV